MTKNTSVGLYRYMREYSEKCDCPALIFGDRVLSYSEFFSEIDRVAGFLAAKGIKKGDVVCVCLRNMPQIAVAVYAVNKAGATANMVHAMNTPLGLRKLMEQTKSKALFIEDIFYEGYAPYLPENVVTVVCNVNDYAGKKEGRSPVCTAEFDKNGKKCYAFTEIDGEVPRFEETVSGDDVCCYMHSGGTTGEPKTVELTNRNFNEMVLAAEGTVGKFFNKENEVAYTVLPMFHGFGLGFGLHTMMCMRCALIMVASFDSAEVGKLIEKYKVTLLTGVPMMYKKLAADESFKKADLSTVRQAYCGGDALDEATINGINAAFEKGGSKCRICEGYGLTEAVSVVTTNRPDNIKNGTIGVVIDGAKAGIFDENYKPVKNGEIGEICMSGKTLMKGYFEDAETTASVIFEGSDGEKWLKTGDLGSMDDDGFITFKGRKKRMIVISGFNVFPVEIEKSAKEIGFVREACAVEGSEKGKPFVALFVETDEGENLSEERKAEIEEHLQKWLPKWSLPKKVLGVKNMPRTAVGKIDVGRLEKTLK